jgi:bacillithiol system protein YtxJ
VTTIEDITSLPELEVQIAASAERPLLLFKHSTRCSVSFPAHAELERFAAELDPAVARVAVILVVEDRAVSNEAAARLGVRHESPQAILVSKGRAVWNASHGDIRVKALRAAIAGLVGAAGSTPAR